MRIALLGLGLIGGSIARALRASGPESAREFHRQLGHRLMGVTMQYIALGHGGEALLGEARQIGHIYAQSLQERGDTLPQALTILFFFRDNMLESALHLPEAAQLRTAANQHLFRRLRDVFNAVELAIVERYEPPPELPVGNR